MPALIDRSHTAAPDHLTDAIFLHYRLPDERIAFDSSILGSQRMAILGADSQIVRIFFVTINTVLHLSLTYQPVVASNLDIETDTRQLIAKYLKGPLKAHFE